MIRTLRNSALLGSFSGTVGCLLVALVVLAATVAPLIATHDPNAIDVAARLTGPSAAHWLGTDNLGRDLWSRLIFGSRIALGASLGVILISLSVGLILGIAAAFAPRYIDQAIQVLFDIVSAFPSLILALALVAVFGPGLGNIILLISIVFVPHFGRVARAQTLSVRNALYLEAEHILAAEPWRILLRHVIPNITGPIFVLASMDIPVVITIEAGLSFLGIGVRPPLASWGSLLNDGYKYLDQAPWLATFAGLALILTTLGFTLFGEALRDTLDPKLRRDR
jgi:peptide/nickel transport system permease protein